MRVVTNDDDGAVAVLIALLAVALFGFGALVIDVGALYSERRQLQSAADAGALAVAQSCAGGDCGDFLADARGFANENSLDQLSRVQDGEVCGKAPLSPDLPDCDSPPTDPPGEGYVQVTSRTQTSEGTLLRPYLAKILDSNNIGADDEGTDVGARATVVWGAPGGLTSAIPVTISICEWDKFTTAGSDLAPPPDYATYPEYGYSSAWLTSTGPDYEHTFFTHDTSAAPKGVQTACPATPPGGDAPGSFGWLSDEATGDDGACTAQTTLSPDGEAGFENQPGNTVPSVCKKGEFPLPGEIVYIPVYDYFTAGADVASDDKKKPGGQHVWYHVEGYAAFYVTGYNLQLGKDDRASIVTGSLPCGGSQRCMSGFFTAGLAPGTGPVVSGDSYGANITQLIS